LPRGGIFTLTGQADRIEMHSSGSFSVIDFKTGRVPTVRQVKTGFSPQLTLEAAMVKRDAFKGLAGQSNDALVYAKLGGRAGGDERFIFEPKKSTDSDDLVERHFSEFLELIDDFWNGARPFLSRPYPEFLKDHAKYDHLARVREWSLTGGGSEEEGEE
jgi:ATP-dependent helicase/nuclease subunit B